MVHTAKPLQSRQFADKRSMALRLASDMYEHTPDWITFFREVLGVDGLVRKLFVTSEEYAAFEKTDEYTEIQTMLARLRDRSGPEPEVTRVITVRIPKSLHESLRDEAHERRTSLNQLCISKLLHVIDGDTVSDCHDSAGATISNRYKTVKTRRIGRKPR